MLFCLTARCAADPVFDRAAALSPPPPNVTRVGQGTGFFITGKLLLTAAHLVRSCRRIDIVTAAGRLPNATRRRSNQAADVALLETTGDHPALPLAPTPPATDGPLTVIAFADSTTLRHVLATGLNRRAQRFNRLNPNPSRELILQATIEHGDSGAPILDQAGAAVGLIQGIIPSADDVAASYGLSEPDIAVGPGLAPIRTLLGFHPPSPGRPGTVEGAVVRVLCWG